MHKGVNEQVAAALAAASGSCVDALAAALARCEKAERERDEAHAHRADELLGVEAERDAALAEVERLRGERAQTLRERTELQDALRDMLVQHNCASYEYDICRTCGEAADLLEAAGHEVPQRVRSNHG